MDARTRFDSANALAQLAAGLVLGAPSEQLAARLFDFLSGPLGLDTYVHYVHEPGDDDLTLCGWHGITDEGAASIRTLPIGEAVCGLVAQQGVPHAVADVPSTTEPEYGLLRGFGLRSYVCHPLLTDSEVLGTLSFGSRTRGSFDEEEVSLLRTASDILAAGLARSLAESVSDDLRERLAAAEEKVGQLQQALDSRVLIEQAKGILAERHGISISEAFERLRQHSRHNRVRIHEVAHRVVAGDLEP